MDRRVAFVTGASRGIGKASAIALAKAGFSVAATARTMSEGERYEHSATVKASDMRPLPGSLEKTAAEIRDQGSDALVLRLDLLDRDSIEAAVEETLARWGRIDVLVDNAIYTGPGTLDRLLDLPVEIAETIFQANVLSPLFLIQRVLPHMLERGSGTIIHLTSAVAGMDPRSPVGEGGWGLAYAASKGALHRMVAFLHVELGDRGIRAYNVEPGFVLTERMSLDLADSGFAGRYRGAPPEVPAAVVAWLASDPQAEGLTGTTVYAQPFCKERGLLPDWP